MQDVLSAKSGDLGPGGIDELFVGLCLSPQTPAARSGLGEQDPRSGLQLRVVGGSGDELGHLPHQRNLLVAIQCARVGQDLNADVVTVAVYIGDRRSGISWTNAAVFFRNIGMSGTCSTAFTRAATSVDSFLTSANVPAVA